MILFKSDKHSMYVYFSVAYLGFTAFLFHKHLSLTSLKSHPLLNHCFSELRSSLHNNKLIINPQMYQGKFGRVFEFDIEFFSSDYSGIASGKSCFLYLVISNLAISDII